MLPTPPENVRVEHLDGRTTPCELVYLGRDEESGNHQWEAVTPVHVKTGDQVRAVMIPAHTGITLSVRANGTNIRILPND